MSHKIKIDSSFKIKDGKLEKDEKAALAKLDVSKRLQVLKSNKVRVKRK